ncbi:MAG: T9SS type A sorting domain-containing protein [Chitinophagales bacterium]
MKTFFIFLAMSLVFSPFASAQWSIPNINFCDTDTAACSYNSTEQIRKTPKWQIYQTLNNEWNGIVDSSICINNHTEHPTNCYLTIKTEDIDTSRPVFIRSQMDSSEYVILQQNGLFNGSFGANLLNGLTLKDYDDACPNGICSGIFMQVLYPDSSGAVTQNRWYAGGHNLNPFFGENYGACFPSEKFPTGQFLKDFFIRLQFEETTPESQVKIYVDFEISDTYLLINQDIIANELIFPQHYNISFDSWFGPTSFLVTHTAEGYPSTENRSYIDLYPSINTTTIDTIDLSIEEYQTLIFQPFTGFRGGLIAGSDTTRHIINIINNGGTLCLPLIVEMIMHRGNNFIYNGGNISLEGERACMQFSEGSNLIIADNQILEYGKTGRGMLALRTGGSIVIGENAELQVHNTMVMGEKKGATKAEQIYMTLNKNSKLTFAEGARLSNHISFDGTMKLNVYMKGGILDDSGLSAADKLLINRIYDTPQANFAQNLHVLQNPTNQKAVTFSFNMADAGSLQAVVYDINGRLMAQTVYEMQKGINYETFDLPNITAGTYLLHIQNENGETATAKWLKME